MTSANYDFTKGLVGAGLVALGIYAGYKLSKNLLNDDAKDEELHRTTQSIADEKLRMEYADTCRSFAGTEVQTGQALISTVNRVSDDVFDPRSTASVNNAEVHPASAVVKATIRDDENYGPVILESFYPTWLRDFPQVIEHVESEHALHVKGVDEENKGLTWHEDKFISDMDPQLNPEAVVPGSSKIGFQMKLGYFIVPASKIQLSTAPSLSPEVAKEMEMKNEKGEVVGYRFFVHPNGYEHFRSLHKDDDITYVSPEHSEFIGTPSSSYRSWIVRHVKEEKAEQEGWEALEGTVPFIIKLGVDGAVLGSDRWLTPSEIDRSVQSQVAFDGMDSKHFRNKTPGGDLFIFAESMGLVLKNIPEYPGKAQKGAPGKESGVLVREFPAEFLKGQCKIISLASLMSVERTKPENRGLCALNHSDPVTTEQLPLIYEVIQATIKAGLVTSPEEFVEKYLIEGYLAAIKKVTFEEGLTLEPHSQNLLMVLNNDNTPRGFAYRDHGGIWIDLATRGLQGKTIKPFYRPKGDGNRLFKMQGAIAKGYIGSYSWFYRYQVFIKMLNTMTKMPSMEKFLPPPPGAPVQINHDEPLPERNLHQYVVKQISAEPNMNALATIQKLSISFEQYCLLLQKMDMKYIDLLNEYFDLEKVNIHLDETGCLPSAEGGSTGENVYYNHSGFLGRYRYNMIESDSLKFDFEKIPTHLKEKIKERVITSFGKASLEELGVEDVLVLKKGLCLLNNQHAIVGFMPYSMHGEKKVILKQLQE